MVFKRRVEASWLEKARELFAPRKGWRRGIDYLGKRMQRLPDTPESIALGFACGVFTSFTPFFGFHFLVAAALAWLLRSNVFASAIGTFFGNPLTFPFIVFVSLNLGGRIMGEGDQVDEGFIELGFVDQIIHLLQNVHELMLPYFIGGFGPGLLCAVASFFLIRPIVRTYQNRRRNKLAARAKARMAAAVANTDAPRAPKSKDGRPGSVEDAA